jgi:hypothetical protein
LACGLCVSCSLIACAPDRVKPLPSKTADRKATRKTTSKSHAPFFTGATLLTIREQQQLDHSFTVTDPDGDPLRVFVENLPPGAQWREKDRRLRFRPDFIQGGRTYHVRVWATDGLHWVSHQLAIAVKDSINPPAPIVRRVRRVGRKLVYFLGQRTDRFLDSADFAGRTIKAQVTVPIVASRKRKVPVKLSLHGYGAGVGSRIKGSRREITIHPYDPMNTYWWGYSDVLCSCLPHSRRGRRPRFFRRRRCHHGTKGRVPNYTQRRALHLLEWVLTTFSGADPDRVYVAGGSMGGSGASTLGLLYARHFCYVHSWIGQTIPRNHRPSRRKQLASLWGAPEDRLLAPSNGMNVWDFMDLTWVLSHWPEAKNQFIFARHGRNDSVIHFGAAVGPSPLTGRSFYQTLQQQRIAHYVVWDEGGHTRGDRWLGRRWFDRGWHLVHDKVSFLRRDLLMPAFSRSSADQDPADGSGNGKRPWHPERGFAGRPHRPGSSGWAGDLAGARNRFLRWDSRRIVETFDKVAIPLRVIAGRGRRAPVLGYPTRGDRVDRPLPFIVDVTLRRQQRFFCLPGERLRWRFGKRQGVVKAAADGTITIQRLAIDRRWKTLELQRLKMVKPRRRRKRL